MSQAASNANTGEWRSMESAPKDGTAVLASVRASEQGPAEIDVVRWAVRLASASRPNFNGAPDFVNQWVSWGAGLRAAQFLVLGAKARALLNGQSHATPADVEALVHPTLRHRILIGYRAEADGVTVDDVIDRLLKHVPFTK